MKYFVPLIHGIYVVPLWKFFISLCCIHALKDLAGLLGSATPSYFCTFFERKGNSREFSCTENVYLKQTDTSFRDTL